jgi:hypothetical protein
MTKKAMAVTHIPEASRAQKDHIPSLAALNADQFLAFREGMENSGVIQIGTFSVCVVRGNKRWPRSKFQVGPLWEGHRGIRFGADHTLGDVIRRVSYLLANKAQTGFDFMNDASTTLTCQA